MPVNTTKVLLIDNFDSFTFMLKDYLEQCGAVCDVIRNNEDLPRNMKQYQGIVISPGPSTPHDAGCTLDTINLYHGSHPILGVCLGHQALGVYFGATLTHAQTPVHGKISAIYHQSDKMFQNILSPFNATRYHSLILKNLPDCLEITAQTSQGEIMAIRHKQLPLWGVQYHPESCLTEKGLVFIKNFLTLLSQSH
jgi:anthranilate synthase/aminodeoxychorismate synthase-like glutamine amidotransferase